LDYWVVPELVTLPSEQQDTIVPFYAGQTLQWKLA
jgi:hypothetical protein